MSLWDEFKLTRSSLKRKQASHEVKQEKKRKREIAKLERQTELYEARAKLKAAKHGKSSSDRPLRKLKRANRKTGKMHLF